VRLLRLEAIGATVDKSNKPAWVVAILLASGAACADEPGHGNLRSEVVQVGDTTLVTSFGEPERHRGGSLQVIWQSPELEDPTALLALDGRVIVADPKRLHILTDEGGHVRTVGRAGGGPGEFGWVTSLGLVSPDTIAVQDALNHRVALFTPEGHHLGSKRVTPDPGYINPEEGVPLVRLRGGVLSLWTGSVDVDGGRPTPTALIWRDLEADTATVLGSWDGPRWMREGGYLAHTELFGPRVIAALGADARFAVGSGIEYCIDVHILMREGVRKVCRDRPPVPVGPGIRRPDLTRIENESRRRAVPVIMRKQEIGEFLPQFDRMLFDTEGRLWVRTVGPEFSEISPYLLRDAPDLLPAYRAWDIFDEAGRLVTTIEIPSNLEPHAIRSGRVYGFVEVPTGEIAIGMVKVPIR
jgi:hypothetical protein